MTPPYPPSKVSPLCRILIQLQTDSVFNLFFASLQEIGGNKNQYTVAGDLEACELQAWTQSARAALSREPWENHQRPRAGHRFRSGARTEKQGIYCLCTKLRNKSHAAPGESHIFSHPFFFLAAASLVLSRHTSLLTLFEWCTGYEPVIMPTPQIWVQNISTTGSVIIR